MRVRMTPVEMLAQFSAEGLPRPVRFRFWEADNCRTVRVDHIVCQQEERLAGNRMFVYECQSEMHGVGRLYELKYEVGTCKWFLSKA